jgi:Listeria/Bacterioides repeat
MSKKLLIPLSAAVILLTLVMLFITGCSSYDVTFDLNYDNAIESKIKRNGTPSPEREGYEFAGWYLDNGTWNNEFSPDSKDLNGEITVYAKWNKVTCTVIFDATEGRVVLSDEEITVRSGEEFELPRVEHRSDSKFLIGWYTDAECKNLLEDRVVYDDTILYAKWGTYYDKDTLVLPKIYIDLLGAERVRKSTYIPIEVSMTNSDEDFAPRGAEIRGRGNSTWGEFEKRPYRIKFNIKKDMFGMGARKDWILLASAMDHSLMRNYITFVMANEMGDPYTSQSQWVHLFIDGKYEGVYLLCEQTESGSYRVDVETDHTAADVDVGFFIEYGGSADIDDDKFFGFKKVTNKNLFYQMTDHAAVIKYPKGPDCTNEQAKYISDYTNQVNTAIMKQLWDDIIELVDIDTFVDNFIVTEIMLNNDMGWNFFFYKPAGGKLCLGPHWDYDQAAGASQWGGETYEGWNAGSPHPWFEALIQMEEFRALVKERWLEVRDFLHSIPDTFIDKKAEEYKDDIETNFIRWKVLGVPHWRSVWSLDKETTYNGHKEYLKTWLKNRLNWIEGQLGIE